MYLSKLCAIGSVKHYLEGIIVLIEEVAYGYLLRPTGGSGVVVAALRAEALISVGMWLICRGLYAGTHLTWRALSVLILGWRLHSRNDRSVSGNIDTIGDLGACC